MSGMRLRGRTAPYPVIMRYGRGPQDPEGVIVRQTMALLNRLGLAQSLMEVRRRPWASNTFEGARYYLAIAVNRSADLAPLRQALADMEWHIPRHMMVDTSLAAIVVDPVDPARERLTIELLCLEDDQ